MKKKGGSYAELHSHSNFSLLDGAAHPGELVARASEMGMAALAVTDHDGLYGACIFYKAAKGAGIKPITGAELSLEGGFHITLLAENGTGYMNLSRLVTKSQLSGVKGEPHLSFLDLEGHTEGLICLSGCAKGEIARFLEREEEERAYRAGQRYRALFEKDRFFIELQSHLNPGDMKQCARLSALAKRLGAGAVATNNAHYGVREDVRLHDVLVCLKNRVTLDGSSAFRKANSEYFLKGYDEMARLPGITEEAIRHSVEIAERCNFELQFSSYSFPDYPLPEGEKTVPYLKRLAFEGARRRYGELSEAIRERLCHELELIEGKGLSGYFLIVWDIMEFARKAGILAQGRGSAASSVVAYVLGITPVDPIRHQLFVGRFLNESAVPDIDIDIGTRRREEVIQYVYEKYGVEHAAMVCTYVTFQSRNAIREVGKTLGLPSHVLDRMAKSVSSYGSRHAMEDLMDFPEFREYLNTESWRHFRDLCARIADFPRHLSIHVGGMLITSKPISEIVPLERARAEGRVVCQWDKDSVDDAGLVKVDLLGLRMLSMIDEITRLIRERHGKEMRYDALPPDDPEVYRMISDADTIGIFQVESRAQMQTLPKVRPRSIEDLAVEVAIVRPGPLQGNMIHPYIRRRQGLEPVEHFHPRLSSILGETMGVILFQEQILQVACEIAGFTTGEANKLRKAMGRKNAREELEKWHVRFIEGAKEREVGEETARKIFDHICGFADFGFCKSHAASFAILCYASAYYKRYYAPEFFCALLNNQPMGFYIPEVVTGDAKRHGVAVLPVHISKSLWECSIEEGAIRIGFRYVKEMGEEKTVPILEERRKGPFLSLEDFYIRTGLDRESLRHLITAGAFDDITRSRRRLLWDAGIMNATGASGMGLKSQEKIPLDEMTPGEELIADYSVQGFSASGHLLTLFRKRLDNLGAVKSSDLPKFNTGAQVRIGGYCVCFQVPPTAKGFAFLTLEDEEGLMNVILKPALYKKFKPLVRLEPFLFVEGTMEKRDGIINVMVKRIADLRKEVHTLWGETGPGANEKIGG